MTPIHKKSKNTGALFFVLLTLCLALPGVHAISSTGLIYAMNPSFDCRFDASGQNNTATVFGTVNLAADNSCRFYGNAVQSQMQVSNNSQFDKANFSISLWVNNSMSAEGEKKIIVGKSNATGVFYAWRIFFETTGEVNFQLFKTDSSSCSVVASSNWTPNTYYHLVMTNVNLNNGNYNMTGYINNVSQGSATCNGALFNNSNSVLKIGGNTQSSQSLNGTIKQLYFFAGRILSTQDISNLYQNLTPSIVIPKVTANFATSTGSLHPFFYGVGNGKGFGSNASWVDTNGDTIEDTPSNYTWHRSELQTAHVSIMRADMRLNLVTNPDGTFNTTTTKNYFNINNKKGLVDYAASQGMKVLFIGGQMPSSMANVSANCSTDNKTCPPTDYDAYANLTVSFLNATDCGIYPGTCMYELQNELDLNISFMAGLLGNDTTKLQYMKAMYNATQFRIKQQFPDVLVGIPALARTNTTSQAFFRYMLANFTNPDFYQDHYYESSTTAFNNEMSSILSWDKTQCILYAPNTSVCNWLIMGEFNTYNAMVQQNQSSVQGQQIAEAYIGGMYSSPANTSLLQYFWQFSTASGTNYSDGYPYKFEMVSEPQLNNSEFAGFNISANMSTWNPARAQVYNTSIDSADFVTVATKLHTYVLTIINKNNYTMNFTAIPSGIVTSNIISAIARTTGTNYSYVSANGDFENISVPANGIEYLDIQTTTLPSTVTLNSPANASASTTGTVNFTFTPSNPNDLSGFASCSVIARNGTVLGTITTITNGSVNNISVTGLRVVPLYWSVNCTDNIGYTASSQTWQVVTTLNLSGLLVNTSVSNTLINFSNFTAYASEVDVFGNNTYIANLTYNTTGANFTFSYNFTTPNIVYLPSQFPNVSSTSANVIQFSSGLNTTVTIIVGTNGIVPSSPLLTFPDGTTVNPSYSYDSVGGMMLLNVTLPSGITTLTLDPNAPTGTNFGGGGSGIYGSNAPPPGTNSFTNQTGTLPVNPQSPVNQNITVNVNAPATASPSAIDNGFFSNKNLTLIIGLGIGIFLLVLWMLLLIRG